ncbi:hypothetical protein [Clostridium massiliodielmoense]|uniref:hypothetical protein n=1 Tax=Clostridium massiliodielmoense TaxID=1776385 RepID=UPI0004DAAFFF|nr:hypothetical protein [Clostridium massiliodielmoense]KEH98080.1 hypothetical protein Z962_01115 [Clostridium botulinum C/D str. BKT12695]
MYNDALKRNLFIARKDVALNNKAIFSGYTFGVYGDVEKNQVSLDFYHKNQVSLDFYGRNIINKDMLKKLILSKEDKSTLGIDKGSVYSLGEIPSFRFWEKTVFKKLDSSLIKVCMIGTKECVKRMEYI